MSGFNQRIAGLIVKHFHQNLTDEEMTELHKWLNASEANQSLFNQLMQEDALRDELEKFVQGRRNTWKKIRAGMTEDKVIKLHPPKIWKNIAAASIILVLLSAGMYIWSGRKPSNLIAKGNGASESIIINDVAPGANRAMLKLANGATVILDNAQTGVLATQENMNVVKLADGQLEYHSVKNDKINAENELQNLPYNTVTTPRGGQYQVVLSDGTKVWLNAASSINYPVAFTEKERKVTITGEVYFEVASQFRSASRGGGKIPFIVKKGDIEVAVLGTHFNVNAYDDEKDLKVTLLEGLVKVSSTTGTQPVFIRPGQQARVTSQKSSPIIVEKEVDTDQIMAWKNGLFQFKSIDIEGIMRQAARWYDLEVVYDKEKPTDLFTGKISREVNLSKLLQILKESAVNFKLEGKRLMISK